MAFTKLHLLPAFVVFVLLAVFSITYIIAVLLGHVRPFFPYISDTGTTPPESTIFGQLMNLGGVFIFLTMYVRYLYINRTYLSDPNLPNHEKVKRINRICVWFSIFIAIGASMVGNFQVIIAIVPHIIGAVLCYVGGTIYFILQSMISYMVCPQLNTLQMARFRLLLAVLSIVLSSVTGLFGIIAFFLFTKTIQDMPKWAPDEGGYELHIVSSLAEWGTTIVMALYFLTFIKEFKNIIVIPPKVELINSTTDCSYDSCAISTVDRTNKKTGEDNNKNIAVSSERVTFSNAVHPV